MSRGLAAAILDVDGTLVDNNYQHALAWHLALRRVGAPVPLWRAHHAIGIGGSHIVAHLAGEEVERERGDEAREIAAEIFGSMKGEVAAVEGATEFVHALAERGHPVVLASSGDPEDIEAFVDMLGIADVVEGWITSAEVEEPKPDPDLVETALEKVGGPPALMVGDTNWDVEAARRAGIDTIAVLTGGFPEAVLREAGAIAVYDSVDHLRRQLADSPFGSAHERS